MCEHARSHLRLSLLFCDVVKHHVHIIVKAPERADELLVSTHYYVYARADTLVNKLERQHLCRHDCLRATFGAVKMHNLVISSGC